MASPEELTQLALGTMGTPDAPAAAPGAPVESPEDLTRAALGTLQPTVAPVEPQGDFSAGVSTGVSQGRQAIGESAVGIGRLLNSSRLEAAGERAVAAETPIQQDLGEGRVTSPTDVRTVGDAAQVAKFAIGAQVPQIGASIAAGVVGAKTGSKIGSPLGVRGKVAGGSIGALLGLMGINTPLMFGEARGEQREIGVDDMGAALKVALKNSAIESASDYFLAGTNKALKLAGVSPSSRLQSIVQAIATNVPIQAATEAAQEESLIRERARLDPTFDLGGTEANERRINAAILGGVVSAPFAGGVGALQNGSEGGVQDVPDEGAGVQLPPGADIAPEPGVVPAESVAAPLGDIPAQDVPAQGIPDSEVPVEGLGLTDPEPGSPVNEFQEVDTPPGEPIITPPPVQDEFQEVDTPPGEPIITPPAPETVTPAAAPAPNTPESLAAGVNYTPLGGSPITWPSTEGEQRVVGATQDGNLVIRSPDQSERVIPQGQLREEIERATAGQVGVTPEPVVAPEAAAVAPEPVVAPEVAAVAPEPVVAPEAAAVAPEPIVAPGEAVIAPEATAAPEGVSPVPTTAPYTADFTVGSVAYPNPGIAVAPISESELVEFSGKKATTAGIDRKRGILSKKVSWHNASWSRGELAQDAVANGAELSSNSVAGVERRTLTYPDGKVVTEKQIGKTAMNYAGHLIEARGDSPETASAPPQEPIPVADTPVADGAPVTPPADTPAPVADGAPVTPEVPGDAPVTPPADTPAPVADGAPVTPEVPGDETLTELTRLAESDDFSALFVEGELARVLNTEQVQRQVDAISQSWTNSPPINVVQSADNLPAAVSFHAAEAGVEPAGVFWNGEAFLVADNIASEESVQTVLAHEVLGHGGVQLMMGSNFVPLAQKIAKDMAGNTHFKDFTKAHRYDMSDTSQATTAVDEYLAHIAQRIDAGTATEKMRAVWSRLVAAVNQFLRSQGMNIKISSADLHTLMLTARERITGGIVESSPTMVLDDKPRYLPRKDVGSNEFQQWFEGSAAAVNGKPMDLYHGTSKSGPRGAAFSAIDTYGGNYGLFGLGGYLTDSPDIGSEYTTKGSGDSPTVYKVYASIKNPMDMDARADPAAWVQAFPDVGFDVLGEPNLSKGGYTNEKFYRAVEDELSYDQFSLEEGSEIVQEGVRGMGHDGITHIGGDRMLRASKKHQVFIAFDPEQVRFALSSGADISIVPPSYLSKEEAAENAFNSLGNTVTKIKNMGNRLKHAGSDVLPALLKVTSRQDLVRNFAHMFKNGSQNLLNEWRDIDREQSAFTDGKMVGADREYRKVRALPKADKAALFKTMDFATMRNLKAGESLRNQPWTEEQWIAEGKHEDFGSLEGAVTDLNKLWNNMGGDARAAYVATVRAGNPNSMHTMFSEIVQAIEGNILDTMEPGESRDTSMASVSKIKQMIKGDYVPLSRFGDYVVVAYENDENGDPQRVSRSHFQHASGAETYKDQLERESEGADIRVFTMPEFLQQTQGIGNAGFINDFERALKQKMLGGMDPEADSETYDASVKYIDNVMEMTRQFYYEQQPEASILKHQMHREGVAGYSQEFDRAYAHYMMKSARTLGTLRYGIRKGGLLKDMRLYLNDNNQPGTDTPPGFDPVRAGIVYNSVVDRENLLRGSTTSPITQALGKYTFFQMLTSMSQYVVQTSQIPLFWVPSMGSRKGVGLTRAATEMGKALGTVSSGRLSTEQIQSKEMDSLTKRLFKKVTPEVRENYPNKRMWDNILTDAELDVEIGNLPVETQELLAMRMMADRGTLDITRSHDLQRGASDNFGIADTDTGHALNRVLDGMGFIMRHSELTNRRVSTLGTLRINRDSGMGYMAAVRDAEDVTLRTQFDYSRANKQPLLAGNWMKIFTQIQSFRFHAIGFMATEFNKAFSSSNVSPEERAEAKRVLAYQMVTTSMYAGAIGTPLGFGAVAAINAIMNLDEDEPYDAVHEADLFFRQFGPAGKTLSTLAFKGAPAALGVDISRRTELGSAFQLSAFDAPEGVTGARYAAWLATQLAGPTYTNFSNIIRAGEAMGDGDIMEASKKILPAGFRDWAKTVDAYNNGVRGGSDMMLISPEQLGPTDYLLMMAGLQPTRLAEMRERDRAVLNTNTVLSMRRTSLIKTWEQAMDDNDSSGKNDAAEAIYAFNKSQPSFAIGKSSLLSAAKTRLKKDMGIQSDRYLQVQKQYGYNDKPHEDGKWPQ